MRVVLPLRGRAGALGVGGAARGGPPATTQLEARVFAGGVAPPAGAAPALANPFRGDRQSAAEGERTFGAMNCDGCHGGGAGGRGGPSLPDSRARHSGSGRVIFHSVYHRPPARQAAARGVAATGYHLEGV